MVVKNSAFQTLLLSSGTLWVDYTELIPFAGYAKCFMKWLLQYKDTVCVFMGQSNIYHLSAHMYLIFTQQLRFSQGRGWCWQAHFTDEKTEIKN